LLAAACSLVTCGQALAGQKAHALCATYKCRTLAADSTVKVFQAVNRGLLDETFQSSFARWLPSGRLTALGDEVNAPEADLRLTQLAVTGRFAAYATVLFAGHEAENSVGWSVYRLNVQTGRREQVDASRKDAFGRHDPGVTGVVVTPKGTVAWIAGVNTRPSTYKVFVLAPGSRTTVLLASATTIEPKSLAAIPGHLYWTDVGVAHGVPVA
jgi:hypothetical protein